MSFTINDIKDTVAAQAHRPTGSASGSVTDSHLNRWITRAIRKMQQYDFDCWRNEFTLTMSQDVYHYLYTDTAWSGAALVRPLRLDGNSIRPAGQSRPLQWTDTIQRIDEVLGGQWKEVGTDGGGTPTYVTEMAQGLIVGAVPDSSFIATSSTMRGYYFRGEDLSTSGYEDLALKMYDDFRVYLEELALVYSLQQEDDSEFRSLLQYWESATLPNMRGYDHVIRDDEPIPPPGWAMDVHGNEDTF
jgi:hypothetical protein